MRALHLALDRWVSSGKEPPARRYPRVDAGQLVSRDNLNFPQIPNVNVPIGPRPVRVKDYGPDFDKGVISFEPPKLGPKRRVLIPAVDQDGNETAGIRLPDLSVPLGTYTGWNLYDPAHGMPNKLNLSGSFIPFAKTECERENAQDPRPSLESRYPSRSDYLGRIAAAALEIVDDGFVLREDVPSIIRSSTERWDYANKQ